MTKTNYIYSAVIDKIVDGDTIDVTLDLGFKIYSKQRIRLARINAPEMKTEEGVKAKEALIGILPLGTAVTIETKKTDIYGRYIGEVIIGDVTKYNLNDQLVTNNQAIYQKY